MTHYSNIPKRLLNSDGSLKYEYYLDHDKFANPNYIDKLNSQAQAKKRAAEIKAASFMLSGIVLSVGRGYVIINKMKSEEKNPPRSDLAYVRTAGYVDYYDDIPFYATVVKTGTRQYNSVGAGLKTVPSYSVIENDEYEYLYTTEN